MLLTLSPSNASTTTKLTTSAVRLSQPLKYITSLTHFSRSMDARHVHPTHRFLDWGHLPSLFGQSPFYEYVSVSCSLSVPLNLATVWPANLVICALFNTLHSQTYAGFGHRGGINRERFFFYCFLASTAWYVVPGYLFQALSYFSWICWIAPKNITVNELFGYVHGMGMSLITFDWAQITYIGSPLATPWWAEANILAGFIFFFWIITPILHYKDVWSGKYMPISSRGSFDNTGHAYNVSRIINADATFNLQQYEAYSPLFISTTFAISYGLSFASITGTLTHALLFFRKQIWSQSRRSMNEQPDIHARLMARYPQVPDWWYATIFCALCRWYLLLNHPYIVQCQCLHSELSSSELGQQNSLFSGSCLPSLSPSFMLFLSE